MRGLPGQHRHDPREDLHGIDNTQSPVNHQKLDDIEPPLTRLELRHDRLRPAEPLRQIDLRKVRLTPGSRQHCANDLVILGLHPHGRLPGQKWLKSDNLISENRMA